MERQRLVEEIIRHWKITNTDGKKWKEERDGTTCEITTTQTATEHILPVIHLQIMDKQAGQNNRKHGTQDLLRES